MDSTTIVPFIFLKVLYCSNSKLATISKKLLSINGFWSINSDWFLYQMQQWADCRWLERLLMIIIFPIYAPVFHFEKCSYYCIMSIMSRQCSQLSRIVQLLAVMMSFLAMTWPLLGALRISKYSLCVPKICAFVVSIL